MRVLIVGAGYVGLPFGRPSSAGHDVSALRRSPGAREAFVAAGLTPLFADISQPNISLRRCPVISIGSSTAPLRPVEMWIPIASYISKARGICSPGYSPILPKKYLYTSSTSVYAQNDGSLVNEESPAEPVAPTSKVLRETESLLLTAYRASKFPTIILRVAGIYGPGRTHYLKQFLSGQLRLEAEGQRYFNMIDRDDLIGVIIAALHLGRPGEIYNVVDDQPVSQRELYQWFADQLARPLPPSAPADAVAERKRGITNKRISNAKLHAELKYRFHFPSYKQGYAQFLAEASPR